MQLSTAGRTVAVEGELAPQLSRWLWLVKLLLASPLRRACRPLARTADDDARQRWSFSRRVTEPRSRTRSRLRRNTLDEGRRCQI